MEEVGCEVFCGAQTVSPTLGYNMLDVRMGKIFTIDMQEL